MDKSPSAANAAIPALFRKIRSRGQFDAAFPDEAACRRAFFQLRWPKGFVCPHCGGGSACVIASRGLFQCSGCRKQTSITSGTALHRTKVPLRKWFLALYRVATNKKGVSALELQYELALGGYRTAWLLLMKVRRLLEEDPEKPLKDVVEVDESFVAARGKGIPPAEKPVVVALVDIGETTGRFQTWRGVRMAALSSREHEAIRDVVRREVRPGARILVDGLPAYPPLQEEGYEVQASSQAGLSRPALRALNPLPHVHLAISNLKVWIAGRFHGLRGKYLPLYLREFVYRVNRRKRVAEVLGRMARRLMTRGPVTLKQLRAGVC